MSHYFPGCGSSSIGRGLEVASREVCHEMGIDLVEFDWVCCGSSPGTQLSPDYPVLAALENLARVRATGGGSLAVGCPGCVRHLEGTRDEVLGDRFRPRSAVEEDQAVSARAVEVVPLWERVARVLAEMDTAGRPGLGGLKVACYYGCRYGRGTNGLPIRVGVMERALLQLGAHVVDFYPREECNGGLHALTRTEIVEERVSMLMGQARASGAEAVAVVCALCQLNLESRSLDPSVPVPFFMQLVGLGLGLPPGRLALGLALNPLGGLIPGSAG